MQLSARVPSVGYPTVAGCAEPAVPSVAFHPLVLGLVLTSLAACGGATKATSNASGPPGTRSAAPTPAPTATTAAVSSPGESPSTADDGACGERQRPFAASSAP